MKCQGSLQESQVAVLVLHFPKWQGSLAPVPSACRPPPGSPRREETADRVRAAQPRRRARGRVGDAQDLFFDQSKVFVLGLGHTDPRRAVLHCGKGL